MAVLLQSESSPREENEIRFDPEAGSKVAAQADIAIQF